MNIWDDSTYISLRIQISFLHSILFLAEEIFDKILKEFQHLSLLKVLKKFMLFFRSEHTVCHSFQQRQFTFHFEEMPEEWVIMLFTQ